MITIYLVVDSAAEGDIKGVYASLEDAECCRNSQFDPAYKNPNDVL